MKNRNNALAQIPPYPTKTTLNAKNQKNWTILNLIRFKKRDATR